MVCKAIVPTIFLMLLFCISNSLAYDYGANQKQTRHNYLWDNFGIGWGTQTLACGLGVSGQLGGHHLISIRGVTFIGMSAENIVFTLHDIGILYGFSTKTPQSRGYCSFAVGLSYVNGRNYKATVGFPIEVQLFLILKSKHAKLFGGIGLYGFANINSEESFVGLLLCAQLGGLW